MYLAFVTHHLIVIQLDFANEEFGGLPLSIQVANSLVDSLSEPAKTARTHLKLVGLVAHDLNMNAEAAPLDSAPAKSPNHAVSPFDDV